MFNIEHHFLYSKGEIEQSNAKLTEYQIHLPFHKELIISKFIDNKQKYVRRHCYFVKSK